ncbi:MAG: response regulator [Oscillospiraceae bacterium]|nr:response regulator [Oscillospiraceae bacterium]
MKKILVLEDEAGIRSFVVINLKRSGYEPIEAATGREALDKMRENPDIKVALLDIMLPDIDGFEVCRQIRATNPRKVCVEGIETEGMRDILQKFHVESFLVYLYAKPLLLDDFLKWEKMADMGT